MADTTISSLPLGVPQSTDNIPFSNGSVTYRTPISQIGGVPRGTIVMWSNYLGDPIPVGWQLCNGTNNTPDLRNRFIVGSGNSYSTGSVGGLSAVALTTSELPSHQHGTGMGWQSNYGGSQGCSGLLFAGGNTCVMSSSVGTNAAHENRPPYYALAFIIKTS